MKTFTMDLLRSTVGRLRRAVPLLLTTVVAASVFGIQPVHAQETIKFGAPLPITGPLAPEALKKKQGYDLWANQVNLAGGINVAGKKMKVEIVYIDYQSNTPRAIQATERLITQDNVQFVFAPFGSGAAKAASTVAERYGVPMIAATASSSQVYDQGYKF